MRPLRRDNRVTGVLTTAIGAANLRRGGSRARRIVALMRAAKAAGMRRSSRHRHRHRNERSEESEQQQKSGGGTLHTFRRSRTQGEFRIVQIGAGGKTFEFSAGRGKHDKVGNLSFRIGVAPLCKFRIPRSLKRAREQQRPRYSDQSRAQAAEKVFSFLLGLCEHFGLARIFDGGFLKNQLYRIFGLESFGHQFADPGCEAFP